MRGKIIRAALPLGAILLIIAAALVARGTTEQQSATSSKPGLNLPGGGTGTNASVPSGLASVQLDQTSYPNGVTVIKETHHDTSPPLRDIPPVPVTPGRKEGPENPRPPFTSAKPVKDSVVQRSFGPLAMPTPILTFDGINVTTSGCGCEPPDTNGDVGPSHYVQIVNTAFEIWDKNGNVVQTARAINTLFSGFTGLCAVTNNGDPVVNYDPLANRWVFSQFATILAI